MESAIVFVGSSRMASSDMWLDAMFGGQKPVLIRCKRHHKCSGGDPDDLRAEDSGTLRQPIQSSALSNLVAPSLNKARLSEQVEGCKRQAYNLQNTGSPPCWNNGRSGLISRNKETPFTGGPLHPFLSTCDSF
ncbi:hypothetical protein RRG08_009426 [Elysia crispata]|uniref:Uncharacterized protein n=1 Tax=Elysia crispata TaxID=231223 RepID=A0AAE0Y8U1_9GAST|nr:hypothetical protein RRG08_009426 [Elysia crispata]